MFSTSNVVMTPGWEPWLRTHGLDRVQGVYGLTAGEIVTRSGSTQVRRLTLPGENGPVTVFLKQYWVNRPAQLWSGAFRGTFFGTSKVRREYENLRRLRDWGLDAPEPVAYGEERRVGGLTRSFLVSAGVAEPTRLDVFIRDRLPALAANERRERRRELLDRLAAYAARLHARRFVHHDLFWRNIILTGQSLDRFFLIDAHKGRPWPAWNERASRAADLAALDAAAPRFFRRAERLRFLLRYLGHHRLTAADKQLAWEILRQAAPLREKQGRRVQGAPAHRP